MKQNLPTLKYFFFLLFICICASPVLSQETVSIEASKDNTLYESGSGSASNGVGAELFVGRTNQANNRLRRALVQFDLSSIPAGATIESATLNVFVGRSAPGSGNQASTLHKLTSDWGEGTSNGGSLAGQGTSATENDATWVHAFSPATTWATAGGDFESSPSASTDLGSVGAYSYTSEDMAADVQSWLDDADANFGWMIRGNETVNRTAKLLISRESSNADRRPTLVVTYTGGNATNIEDVESVSLRIFPNPSLDGNVRLEAEGLVVGTVDLQVINLVGQNLIRKELNVLGGRIQQDINLSSWGAGIYFIHLRTESGTRTQKVIVK
ncbi:MAG: DNRLRE domain-containing protein [Bacteroidota bacterium]